MFAIRQASLSDLVALIELNQKIMVNNRNFDDDLIVEFASTPTGESFFRDSIENKMGCCLIAELDGQMVGYADGEHKVVPYRKSKYFEISNLGVVPEMKGKGLGRKLLEAISQWANDHGYQKMYLNCYAQNREALDFYKKNGYQEIDVCLEKEL